MITTITTTAAEDARVAAAFGDYLRLGRNATASEVKAELVKLVRAIVKDHEDRITTANAVATAPAPISPA